MNYTQASPTRRLLKRFARHSAVALTDFVQQGSSVLHLGSPKLSVRILMYHSVSDTPNNPFSVSPTSFAAQMDILTQEKCVVSMDEAYEYLLGHKELTRNVVVITLDDGLKDNYLTAYPILRERELPAIIYLPTGFLEEQNDRHISWDEAQKMLNHRITFGSHTVRHKSLTKLEPDQIREELLLSWQTIENRLGAPMSHVSYPFGTFRDFSTVVSQIARDIGYKTACTAISGVNLPGRDCFTLHRTKIEYSDNIKMFSAILRGAIDSWYLVDKFASRLQSQNR